MVICEETVLGEVELDDGRDLGFSARDALDSLNTMSFAGTLNMPQNSTGKKFELNVDDAELVVEANTDTTVQFIERDGPDCQDSYRGGDWGKALSIDPVSLVFRSPASEIELAAIMSLVVMADSTLHTTSLTSYEHEWGTVVSLPDAITTEIDWIVEEEGFVPGWQVFFNLGSNLEPLHWSIDVWATMEDGTGFMGRLVDGVFWSTDESATSIFDLAPE